MLRFAYAGESRTESKSVVSEDGKLASENADSGFVTSGTSRPSRFA